MYGCINAYMYTDRVPCINAYMYSQASRSWVRVRAYIAIYVSMYLDIHLYIWMDVYREIGALQAGPGGKCP